MILEVDSISKIYHLRKFLKKKKEFVAVKDVSFDVDIGECVGLIGANGAGKSSIIKMLTGIIEPTKGNITVLGLSPTKNRKILNYQISVFFGQRSQLLYHLPPNDSFKLIGSIYDLSLKQQKERIEELSEEFEIGNFINVPVYQLSLGQRIRCEIVASLLHRPKILFLDEPTLGLDILVKKKLRALLTRMKKEENITIFLTSHDLTDVETLCDKIMIIEKGKIIFNNTLSYLKNMGIYGQKTVKIQFFSPLKDELDINDINIGKDRLELKFRISNMEKLSKIIAEICEKTLVKDIEVTSPSLEDVISSMYLR